jgi:hypothetical protein
MQCGCGAPKTRLKKKWARSVEAWLACRLTQLSGPVVYFYCFSQVQVAASRESAAEMAEIIPPTLTYWERLPPLAAVAAGKISGVAIELNPNPKLGKDAQPVLAFPTG